MLRNVTVCFTQGFLSPSTSDIGGLVIVSWGFPGATVVKNLPANSGNSRNVSLIHGSGRFPGEGNGNPLQYSCLENPMDGGALCRLLSMGSQRVGHD